MLPDARLFENFQKLLLTFVLALMSFISRQVKTVGAISFLIHCYMYT